MGTRREPPPLSPTFSEGNQLAAGSKDSVSYGVEARTEALASVSSARDIDEPG
ncbi:MAG: hypothetical protein ABIZ96_08235 [Gemmatimonadales bacterium]